MEKVKLDLLEKSLKKRCTLPYLWLGQKQSNLKDFDTNFIYQIRSFSQLQNSIKNLNDKTKNYALNRWYNFWSAMAIEQLFTSHNNVVAHINAKNKFIDFSINTIPFDHKSSVFPKTFGHSMAYAKKNPRKLIHWLYNNQSSEGRQHYKNRLFMVFYDRQNSEHWKLKAEIDIIKNKIDNYLIHFNPKNLYTFDFGQGEVLSDIIWIEN